MTSFMGSKVKKTKAFVKTLSTSNADNTFEKKLTGDQSKVKRQGSTRKFTEGSD